VRSRIVPMEHGPDCYDKFTRCFIRNQSELAAFVIKHRNDPETIDLIGFKKTMDLIVTRFNKMVDAYFAMWREGPEKYTVFRAWLKPIGLLAIKRCRAKWHGRRYPGDERDWFDRMVLPNAVAQLEIEADSRWHAARDFEKQHPEKSLTALPGDLPRPEPSQSLPKNGWPAG